ncbi:hypothetical protein Ancab_011421 [Ancistrocladus abbreviatus]
MLPSANSYSDNEMMWASELSGHFTSTSTLLLLCESVLDVLRDCEAGAIDWHSLLPLALRPTFFSSIREDGSVHTSWTRMGLCPFWMWRNKRIFADEDLLSVVKMRQSFNKCCNSSEQYPIMLSGQCVSRKETFIRWSALSRVGGNLILTVSPWWRKSYFWCLSLGLQQLVVWWIPPRPWFLDSSQSEIMGASHGPLLNMELGLSLNGGGMTPGVWLLWLPNEFPGEQHTTIYCWKSCLDGIISGKFK